MLPCRVTGNSYLVEEIHNSSEMEVMLDLSSDDPKQLSIQSPIITIPPGKSRQVLLRYLPHTDGDGDKDEVKIQKFESLISYRLRYEPDKKGIKIQTCNQPTTICFINAIQGRFLLPPTCINDTSTRPIVLSNTSPFPISFSVC